MAEIDAKKQKEILEKIFQDNFLPKWKERFSGELADGSPWIERLGHKMYGSEGMARRGFDDFIVRGGLGENTADALSGTLDFYDKASKTPFATPKTHVLDVVEDLGDGKSKTIAYNVSPMGETLGGAWNYAKANPGAVLGTAATTAGSLAGLFDNDKIGGQLVATGLGAAVPKLLGMKLNPLMSYNIAAGAGTLGALFDKLREKKADERAAMTNNPYGRESYVR